MVVRKDEELSSAPTVQREENGAAEEGAHSMETGGELMREKRKLPEGAAASILQTNGDSTDADGAKRCGKQGGRMDEKTRQELVSLVENTQLKSGDNWYLIDFGWWNKFRATVPVGPIDNFRLLENGEGELRRNLLENHDFALVPEAVFTRLRNCFGVLGEKHVIQRKVISEGLHQTMNKVELYLIKLQVALMESQQDQKSIVLSRVDTLSDLLQKVQCLLNLDPLPANKTIKLHMKHGEDNYEYVNVAQQGESTPVEDVISSGGDSLLVVEVVDTFADSGKSLQTGSKSTVPPVPPDPPSKLTSSTAGSSSSRAPLFGGSMLPSAIGTAPTSSAASSGGSGYTIRVRNNSPARSKPGHCGLQNLGNTCFMNSALQCLSNVPELTDYLLSEKYKDDLNEENPLGMHGHLAIAYGDLMKQMWSGQTDYCIPRRLKQVIGQFAPQFSGFQQQDSQELLAFLLDGLHEDLNRIRKKPYVEEKEHDGQGDEKLASLEAWSDYKKRNDSIVVDIFHGQFKSRLVCPECNKPNKLVAVEVAVVPKRGKTGGVTKLRVTVPKVSPSSVIREEIEKLLKIDADTLQLAKVDRGELCQLVFDKDPVCPNYSSSLSGKWYAYEVEEVPEDDEPVNVICSQYQSKSESSYVGGFSASSAIGYPLLVRMPKRDLDAKSVAIALAASMDGIFIDVDELPEQWWKDGENNNDSDAMETNSTGQAENGADLSMDGHDAVIVDDNGNRAEGDSDGDASQPELFQLTVSASRTNRLLFKYVDFPKDGPFVPASNFYSSPIPSAWVRLVWHPSAMKNVFNQEWEGTTLEHPSVRDTSSVNQPKKQITVHDCLELFTKEEQLGEQDSWYCPQCKAHRRAFKKMDLWSLPEILIVHLKRFQSQRWSGREKIEAVVDFPVKGLDMREFVLSGDQEPIYDLIGVSNHMGGLGGGHYTAVAYNNGEWVDYADSHCTIIGPEVDNDRFSGRNAYVLVYRRRYSFASKPFIHEPNIEIECDE